MGSGIFYDVPCRGDNGLIVCYSALGSEAESEVGTP